MSIQKTLNAFWRVAFPINESGIVCLAAKPVDKNTLTERFFNFPGEMETATEWAANLHYSHDLYFCAQFLNSRQRSKANVDRCPSAWADLDECNPKEITIPPSAIIQTSQHRFQALWVFDEPQEAAIAEDISRRIAYAYADKGADKSGWDLTQLLRIPGTTNHKYRDLGAFTVRADIANPVSYPAKSFDLFPQVKEFSNTMHDFPEDTLPDTEFVRHKYMDDVSHLADRYFLDEPQNGADWSSTLWNLEKIYFEAGASREEVFVIARDSACNKYRRENRPPSALWRDVCRAWADYDNKMRELVPSVEGLFTTALLSDDERNTCMATQSFIEDYIEWAKKQSDASWQYHQAGAFVILSTLLSASMKLETSFGTLNPNLWFMILADTTLTRKTTSMDMAMDLLSSVDDNAVLATDGSIEGLFSAMEQRPNMPSIFLRDEFSGLLEGMAKKDYMAGTAEMFTKLYDGKMQKRVLRKETISIKNPILIMYTGGTKNRVYEALGQEHIASGFLPRFIFITAEADITKVRPVGPPTEIGLEGREKLVDFMAKLQEFYKQRQSIRVSGGPAVTTPKAWTATMTKEAWARYNDFEATMSRIAYTSEHRESLTPAFDRLCKSGLKAAMLIAATRMDEELVITLDDLIRAFYYVEQWRVHTVEVIKNVGRTNFEKLADAAIAIISREPGILRGDIMRRLHLTAKNADDLFITLEQRGYIDKPKKHGKSYQLYAL